MQSRACIRTPGAVYGSQVSAVKRFAWELMCFRLCFYPTALHPGTGGTFAHVPHWCTVKAFSIDGMMLIAHIQAQGIDSWHKSKGLRINTNKTFLVSSISHGILKKSSWNTPVFTAFVVSATTPPSARNWSCGYTSDTVVSLNDWYQAQTMSALGVMTKRSTLKAELWLKCWRHVCNMMWSGRGYDSAIVPDVVLHGESSGNFCLSKHTSLT